MQNALQVADLHKSYGEVQAVKGISFYVEQGRLFAFLGPNGAGKSTTIDILCTLLRPDSGTVTVCGRTLGREDAAIRAEIGVVFQDNMLDALLTVRENLLTRGGLYGLDKPLLHESVQRAAKAAGVTDFMNRPYGKLSGGQRRRADIARALIHTPKILFLDEPTTGLDPQTRRNIWETIRALQAQSGMTVFLTTHYMEEAAEADYVIVIDDGLIAAKGTPNALKRQYSSDTLTLRAQDMELLGQRLSGMGIPYTLAGDAAVVKLAGTMNAIPIIEAVKDCVINLEILNGTMDDAFIGITGKEIRE